MTTMVEVVARALARRLGMNPDEELYPADRGPLWRVWEDHARVVIEAMHDPADEALVPRAADGLPARDA